MSAQRASASRAAVQAVVAPLGPASTDARCHILTGRDGNRRTAASQSRQSALRWEMNYRVDPCPLPGVFNPEPGTDTGVRLKAEDAL